MSLILLRRCAQSCGFVWIGLALAAMTASVACGAPPGDPALVQSSPPLIRIVHAWGENSSFTPVLRDALARGMPGVRVDMLDTSAGITTLLMLQRGEVDAAFIFADTAYLASVGQLPDLEEPFGQIRGIAELPTRALQVVVAAQSPVRSIRDLRGRRVSLGPPNGGATLTAELTLNAFGITVRDITAERLPFDEAARQLIQGTLDAAFWGGTFPNANIANATRHGARLLQVAGPEIEPFRAEYPFLRLTEVPAGTYPGVDQPVRTVGVDGIFVCRADLDERVVHDLTRAFVQAVTSVSKDVRPLQGLNMSRAASTPVPLHPGAARYYREWELFR